MYKNYSVQLTVVFTLYMCMEKVNFHSDSSERVQQYKLDIW